MHNNHTSRKALNPSANNSNNNTIAKGHILFPPFKIISNDQLKEHALRSLLRNTEISNSVPNWFVEHILYNKLVLPICMDMTILSSISLLKQHRTIFKVMNKYWRIFKKVKSLLPLTILIPLLLSSKSRKNTLDRQPSVSHNY
jgi:hypothetical protein